MLWNGFKLYSGLVYTVIRPPVLSDGSLISKVSLKNMGNEVISWVDVVQVVVEAIKYSCT